MIDMDIVIATALVAYGWLGGNNLMTIPHSARQATPVKIAMICGKEIHQLRRAGEVVQAYGPRQIRGSAKA